MIPIVPGFALDESTLEYRFARSGGPGGQNVNKVETRVIFFFDIERCAALSVEQRRALLRQLATRIDKQGRLRVVCQTSRSQRHNRDEALARLVELLKRALTPARPRVPSRVPAAEKRRRLGAKRRRADLKRSRAE